MIAETGRLPILQQLEREAMVAVAGFEIAGVRQDIQRLPPIRLDAFSTLEEYKRSRHWRASGVNTSRMAYSLRISKASL